MKKGLMKCVGIFQVGILLEPFSKFLWPTWIFNKLINEIESLKLNNELTYVHISLNKENKKKNRKHNWIRKSNKKTLCVITIAMICSSLASLWKFQYFQRSTYNPVEHLWWSFYCKNSEPLRIFIKKLHHRCLLGF